MIGVIAAVTVTAVALALLGLEIYRTRVIVSDWDRTRDDADFGARGVETLTEELEAIRVYLARTDTAEMPVVRTDTVAAPALIAAAGGARIAPTPYRREGRHAA